MVTNKVELPRTLFGSIRTQYQSIVEDLLARDQPEDKTLSEFKARHSFGAFLCRHHDCSRAAIGFNTDELRQKHEATHVPQFRCTGVACGFSGWTFKTRTALNKHATTYHGEISIPSSLTGITRRPRQDRPLFVLKMPPLVSQTRVSPEERDQVQGQTASNQQPQPYEMLFNKDLGKPDPFEHFDFEQFLVQDQSASNRQSQPYEMPFNKDLGNPDLLEHFDFEQFLRSNDSGDFSFESSAFQSTDDPFLNQLAHGIDHGSKLERREEKRTVNETMSKVGKKAEGIVACKYCKKPFSESAVTSHAPLCLEKKRKKTKAKVAKARDAKAREAMRMESSKS